MKKNKIVKEDLSILSELIRKAYSLIYPDNYNYELKMLMDKTYRTYLSTRCPKCYMPVNIGRDVPFFPVCNRGAIIDPKIIDFSLKLSNKLLGHEKVNQDHLNGIIVKLKTMKNKFEKEIPKPNEMSIRKSAVTKNLNKIRMSMPK